MRSKWGEAGRLRGAEGTLMRDGGGVWALHNKLLWLERPNEPEMKELRGSLEDASLLRYFSHCSAGTASVHRGQVDPLRTHNVVSPVWTWWLAVAFWCCRFSVASLVWRNRTDKGGFIRAVTGPSTL